MYISIFCISILLVNLCILLTKLSVKKSHKGIKISTLMIFSIFLKVRIFSEYIYFMKINEALSFIHIICTITICLLINKRAFKNNLVKLLFISQIVLLIANFILNKVELSYFYLNGIELVINLYIFWNLLKINLMNYILKKDDLKKQFIKSVNLVKEIKEKLRINENITKVVNESLNRKYDILDLILNECNQCTFLIDSQGYIINEDESFSKVWKSYEGKSFNISLKEFLNDNIKDTSKFTKDLIKVETIVEELEDEFQGMDGKYYNFKFIRLNIGTKSPGVICIAKDITYKKNSQMKIKENDTKYKQIVDNIPYSIMLTTSEKIIYSNMGENRNNFCDNEFKNLILKKSLEGEINYTTQNGDKLCLDIDRIEFLEDKEERSLIVAKDISYYKKVQKELEHSKERYESLVNLIPEGIYVYDYDSKELNYTNQTINKMLGEDLLKEYILKHKSEPIFIQSEDTYDKIEFNRLPINDINKNKIHIEKGEITIPINNKLKNIGIIRDITDQVKAEIMNKEIEEKNAANKIKNEFFINMSHELKTPINLIHSSNQLLERLYKKEFKNNEKNEMYSTIQEVKKNIHVLRGLIDNIIELAKLRSDLRETLKDNYNIVPIVEDTSLALNNYISKDNINIVFDTDEEEMISSINPEDIESIVITILTMVVRYSMANSNIYVNLSSIEGYTVVSIKNIGRYDCKKYKSDKYRRNLDIGLMVSKSILEIYKGEITINLSNNYSIEVIATIQSEQNAYIYNDRVKNTQEDYIYGEYIRLCNF